MEVVRAIRFKVGEGAWSLEIKTFGTLEYVSNVQLGFYWRDKPFPTHEAVVEAEEFLEGLVQIGLIDATVSSERKDSGDSPSEELSPDEVFRAWSSTYSWPKEKPTTTWGESSGDRRPQRTDFDVSGRGYFEPNP